MPNFKPLNSLSQSHSEKVFYLNADASAGALISNATARVHSLMNLHSDIANLQPGSGVDISYLGAVSSYLLSDVYSLLEELEGRTENDKSDKTLIDQQAKTIIALTEIIGESHRAKTEQGGIMSNQLKTFRINGRAVNKRGLTVGITQDVTATSDKEAVAEVTHLTTVKGFSHIRIVLVREVNHV